MMYPLAKHRWSVTQSPCSSPLLNCSFAGHDSELQPTLNHNEILINPQFWHHRLPARLLNNGAQVVSAKAISYLLEVWYLINYP